MTENDVRTYRILGWDGSVTGTIWADHVEPGEIRKNGRQSARFYRDGMLICIVWDGFQDITDTVAGNDQTDSKSQDGGVAKEQARSPRGGR